MLVLLLSACSGSTSNGGSGSCGSAPCGGNPTGTWNAEKVCIGGSITQSISGCTKPATITMSSVTVNGTMKVASGGTWTSAYSESFSAHIAYGQGCVTSAAACSQVATAMKQQPNVSSASCSFSTTCECDYSGTANNNSTGTYKLNGSQATLTTTGSSTPTTDGYCVAGNTLTLTNNTLGFTSSIVFTR